jgi:hypothetical protein
MVATIELKLPDLVASYPKTSSTHGLADYNTQRQLSRVGRTLLRDRAYEAIKGLAHVTAMMHPHRASFIPDEPTGVGSRR